MLVSAHDMNPKLEELYANLTASVLGADHPASLMLVGLLAEGHVLIQGAPGLGKTSLAKSLAQSFDCEFRRIQFTPDLLPADILGYTIFDQAERRFVFHRGPVFSHIILADEINRASPRVQSALLECMSESQVSMDGVTHRLEKPFFVVATENHLTSLGTFPLPDSQLDRFLVSFAVELPDREVQLAILKLHAGGEPAAPVKPAMTRDELCAVIAEVRQVRVGRNVMDYVVALAEAIRAHADLEGGLSSRASIALMTASRAAAYLEGRPAVYPDDVKSVMPYVFRHRLSLKGDVGKSIHRVEAILHEILEKTPVPMGARA